MPRAGVPVSRDRAEPIKQKLTSLTTKLRPAAKPYLVWDTAQRGLALLIQPSGYRAYKLIYRFHGRPRWLTIGAADAIALANARKEAAKLMLRVIQGEDPAAEKRAKRGAGTFAEMANRYVEEHAKNRNKSWRQGAALVSRYLLPLWGKLSANSITRSDVRAMMRKMSDAPILANQVLASASAIFTWATKQELLANNPCRGVERNATVSRERVLADTELLLFWQAFGEADAPGMALRVLLLTGQRPGEVTHMRHDQITDGWWTLPGAPDAKTGWKGTKNGVTHRVWLPQSVQNIIAGLNVGDDFVFGQPLELTATMRNICTQLKVPRATPHDLRRTHGSTITRLGFGRDAMNRIQNHKEGGIADVYDRHSYENETKRIMEAVAGHLLMLTRGDTAPSNVVTANFSQRAFTQPRDIAFYQTAADILAELMLQLRCGVALAVLPAPALPVASPVSAPRMVALAPFGLICSCGSVNHGNSTVWLWPASAHSSACASRAVRNSSTSLYNCGFSA
jgi:integrase